MAPRKEKVEKLSVDQGTALILNYLREQNRPYSANDVSVNLHNKVTKAYASKALKDMQDRNEVVGRVSGKQIVYHTLQDPREIITPEELAEMDKEIESLREAVATAKAQDKALKAELTTLNNAVSTTGLRDVVAGLEVEKGKLVEQLERLQAGNPKAAVSTEERRASERQWRKWKKTADARRKICKELWTICAENRPENVTKEDLWEELGLEGEL